MDDSTSKTAAAPATSTAKSYRIVSGSFRDSDGSIKGIGETIELAPHDAERHGEMVVPADAPVEAHDDAPVDQTTKRLPE